MVDAGPHGVMGKDVCPRRAAHGGQVIPPLEGSRDCRGETAWLGIVEESGFALAERCILLDRRPTDEGNGAAGGGFIVAKGVVAKPCGRPDEAGPPATTEEIGLRQAFLGNVDDTAPVAEPGEFAMPGCPEP